MLGLQHSPETDEDFLWSPAPPLTGKPGHLCCHLTDMRVGPCTGHVRTRAQSGCLTQRMGSCCHSRLPDLSQSRPALLTAFPPLLGFHGLRAVGLIILFPLSKLLQLLSSLPFPLLLAHEQSPITKPWTLPPTQSPGVVGSNVGMAFPEIPEAREQVSSGFLVHEATHVNSRQATDWPQAVS